MIQQRNSSPKKVRRKRSTGIPLPAKVFHPYHASNQLGRQNTKNNHAAIQNCANHTVKKCIKTERRKKEGKLERTNPINFRDSSPLLFLPPKIKDRQIKKNKNHIKVEFEENDEELIGEPSHRIEIELSNQESIYHPIPIPNEPQSDENKALQNIEEDDIPIGDAEATVAAMKDYVKEHLSPLIESSAFTGGFPDLDPAAPFEDGEESPLDGSLELKAESLKEEDFTFEKKETSCRENGLGNCSINTLPFVKLPTLLAVLNVDIDILETVDLSVPVQEIIKTDWEAHSVVLQVLLPSTKVFLRGILTAELDYLQDQETGIVHHQKINIPWNKVVEVNWLYPPELSSSQLKEYMFRDRNYVDGQSHYESIKSFSDSIQFNVSRQHSVWAYELLLKDLARTIEFQGTIILKIQLFQNQLVNLNKVACRPL